jgi:hypothetical protein
MEEFKLLLEDYKRRLKTADHMLKKWELGGKKSDVKVRLETKASCFRTFISELERAIVKESLPKNVQN